MLPTRLIIVEGLPGLGKSTTAQHIAIALEKRNIPCRWYYEADRENPVSGFYEPQFYGTPPEFVAAQEERWKSFAHDCQTRDHHTILESSLFQETIFGLLQYNVPQPEIRAFVHDIVRIIAPLQPIVVYLFHEQPAVAISRVCEIRGPSVQDVYIERNDESPFAHRRDLFGFLGLARFWAEYKIIADRLFEELRFRKLLLDVTHGHTAEHETRILDFLGLPPIAEQPVSPEYLQRFTGAYASHPQHQPRTFDITLHEPHLIAHDCPILWPQNRLLPRGHNTFYAESWPYLITFQEDPTGQITTMTITEGPNPIHHYPKIH